MTDDMINMEYEYQELIKKSRHQAKMAIIIGIIFILTSILFTVLGIVIDKPLIFIGALMQLFAGCILIIANSK